MIFLLLLFSTASAELYGALLFGRTIIPIYYQSFYTSSQLSFATPCASVQNASSLDQVFARFYDLTCLNQPVDFARLSNLSAVHLGDYPLVVENKFYCTPCGFQTNISSSTSASDFLQRFCNESSPVPSSFENRTPSSLRSKKRRPQSLRDS